MRLLEVGIGPVQGVADPILAEALGLGPELPGNGHVAGAARRSDPVLVDVVAEVDDHVEVFLGHPVVRGVVAGRPVLARREREREGIEGEHRPRVSSWSGPRGSRGRRLGTGRSTRSTAGAPAPRRGRSAPAHGGRPRSPTPRRSTSIRRGPPPNPPRPDRRHPAGVLERVGSQAGPEHDAVGSRVSGGHAQRERVRTGRSRRPHGPGRQLRQAERRGHTGRELQESAAVDRRKDLGAGWSGCHRRTSSSDATPRWIGLSRPRERPQTTW